MNAVSKDVSSNRQRRDCREMALCKTRWGSVAQLMCLHGATRRTVCERCVRVAQCTTDARRLARYAAGARQRTTCSAWPTVLPTVVTSQADKPKQATDPCTHPAMHVTESRGRRDGMTDRPVRLARTTGEPTGYGACATDPLFDSPTCPCEQTTWVPH